MFSFAKVFFFSFRKECNKSIQDIECFRSEPTTLRIINFIHLSIHWISGPFNNNKNDLDYLLTIYRDYSLDHYCMNYINHCRTNCHCTKIDRPMLLADTRTDVDLPTFQIPMNQSKTSLLLAWTLTI